MILRLSSGLNEESPKRRTSIVQGDDGVRGVHGGRRADRARRLQVTLVDGGRSAEGAESLVGVVRGIDVGLVRQNLTGRQPPPGGNEAVDASTRLFLKLSTSTWSLSTVLSTAQIT